MNKKQDLENQILRAAAENGINSVLLRNAMGRKLGLNITDSECLTILGMKGISHPKELARYTGLTTGSTTAMLDRLEKAGFIKRKPNPKDRRSILIEITEESSETTLPLVAGIQKAHRDLIASYSEEELKTITDFFTRFAKNIKEHTELIEQDLSKR